MEPAIVTLDDHTHGDTWNAPVAIGDDGGLTIGPVVFIDDSLVSSDPPAAMASCRLYFRDPKRSGKVAYGFKSVVTVGFGTITIVDPVLWEVWIPPQLLPLAVGDWEWDFEVTDAAGSVRTLYEGVLTVIADVSYDDNH